MSDSPSNSPNGDDREYWGELDSRRLERDLRTFKRWVIVISLLVIGVCSYGVYYFWMAR